MEDKNKREVYLEVFWQFDLDESLLILNEKIGALPKDDFEISEKIFQTSKNNERIGSEIIRILSGFRKTEYFVEAIELLIKALEIQPSLFMEIYFAIKGFIYDENSYIYDYKKEFLLIEKIWDLRKNKKNKYLDFIQIDIHTRKCFAYQDNVFNPVADTVVTATYIGADVDWYIKAEDIILKNGKQPAQPNNQQPQNKKADS